MGYDPAIHHRRSIRLQGYDYSCAGAYFVTICTHNRLPLFGDIADRQMRLNDAGRMVETCWTDIPAHFPHAELDEWVVMPNHVHGIVIITNIGHDAVGANVRAKNFSPLQFPSSHRPGGASKTIGSIVRGFKIGVTKWIRQNTSIHDVWQRNYWEHVVRNETELAHIREYIRNNPAQWDLDKLFVPFSPAELDKRVVMPRHVHGIAVIRNTGDDDDVRAKNFSALRPAPTSKIAKESGSF